MTRPPFDLEFEALDMPRLKRLAKAMQITLLLADWVDRYEQYQSSEDVQENTASRMRF